MAGHARKLCIFLSCSSRVQFLAAHRNSFCNCAVFKSAATLTALKLKQFEAPPGSNKVCLELNHFNYRILDVQGFWSSYGPLVTLHDFAMRGLEVMRILQDLRLKVKKDDAKTMQRRHLVQLHFLARFCPRCGKLLCTVVLTLKSWLAVLFLRGGALEMSAVLQTPQLFQSCK